MLFDFGGAFPIGSLFPIKKGSSKRDPVQESVLHFWNLMGPRKLLETTTIIFLTSAHRPHVDLFRVGLMVTN